MEPRTELTGKENWTDIMKKPEMNLGAKSLLGYLAIRAQETRGGVSRETIMEELGISMKTFYTYLNLLVEMGYIRKEQGRENGKYGSTGFETENPKLAESVEKQGPQGFAKAVLTNKELEVKTKIILLHIESLARDGVTQISWEEAKEQIGISRDTFYKAIKDLNQKKFISSITYRESRGFKKTDYRIEYDEILKQNPANK